jgi:hypothetical protein
MAKISLVASGGLNKDIDPNNLPQGDYSDASNIIYDIGVDGGAGAIKMVDSIKEATSVGTIPGTIKATFQSPDGYIYVLSNTNGTSATIYRLNSALDTAAVAIVTYTHGVSDSAFVPDLKVLGDCLIWNYCGDGTVLIYSILQGIGVTLSVADLTLQKRTPNNVVTIVKAALNPLLAKPFLEVNDVQFASRYQYISGEFSVLSNYSQMYKAEKGVVQYDLTYDFTNKPTFAETLEVYVRVGNAGTWRRIDSNKIGIDPGALTWTGQVYESLDSVTATKSFDAVPTIAKHIEIAKNRIFLANVVDDNTITASNLLFTLSEDTEYGHFPTTVGGTYNSYLEASLLAESGINSSETSSPYYKPFANDSNYGVGFAYYDEAMKTRGVEKYINISTGKFVYPILSAIDITLQSGWQRPAWAKYAQLVYTKNKDKSYFYEGYASNIFFELTQINTNPTTGAITEEIVLSQSITKDQLKSVKSMVVDLMGMFRANAVYNFTDGDRISINTGTNGILNLKITGQNGNLIYCDYTGAEMSNPTVPNASVFYFEIFTPKQVQENESLVFYEYGNLMDITGWSAGQVKRIKGAGTINTDKLIGDTVFQKLELPVYSASPFTKTTSKTSPAEVTTGVQTQVNCQINSPYGSGFSIISTTSSAPSDVLNVPYFTSFTTGQNQDGANILDSSGAYASSGPEVALSGYYDVATQLSSNFLTVEHKLLITKNIPFAISGSCEWAIYAKVMRVPYNNSTNTYGSPVNFINEQQLYTETVTSTQTNVTYNLNYTQTITLAAYGTDIGANDKFYITYRLTVPLMAGPSSLNINVKKQTAVDNGVVFSFIGSRTAPKITTSYNPDAKVSATKTKFVVRSISNAVSNQLWNTSAGKPSVQVTKTTSSSSLGNRTNTIRYGGNYIVGTKVNNLSSFFALDSADVPTENGKINSLQRVSRLQGNGSMLLALCEKEVAYALLGEQELLQGDNSTVVSLSSNVIGTIRNIGYNYGLQDKLSAHNYRGTVWWWDNFNKKVLRYTEQGAEIVSDMFMKSFFLKKSGVMRFSYDSFYNMCFAGLVGEDVSVGYSDNRKRWVASYSFRPDFSESFGDKTMMIKGNKVYKTLQSNNKTDYNSFFGNSYDSSISYTVNSRLPVQPINLAIWHDMNVMDYTKDNFVKSGLMNIEITNDNNQRTTLNSTNFLVEDNRLYAHVMRDLNTPVTAVPSEILKEQTFTATAGQTTFTITDGYILGAIEVYVDSVLKPANTYVATNGTTVVFNTGATVGQTVRIVNTVDKRLTEGYYIIGYLNKFVVTLTDRTQNMRINSIDVELKPVVGHS